MGWGAGSKHGTASIFNNTFSWSRAVRRGSFVAFGSRAGGFRVTGRCLRNGVGGLVKPAHDEGRVGRRARRARCAG